MTPRRSLALALLVLALCPPVAAQEPGRHCGLTWARRAVSTLGRVCRRVLAPAPTRAEGLATCRTIPIGSDHAGFALKQELKAELERLGYKPLDLGTRSAESVDYADFAHPVAEMISSGRARLGVLICGTGLGMSMAANRHVGVRAAVCWSPEIAEVTRQHNDANILALPARHLTGEQAKTILERFLSTPFEGGRHERRIQKIETGSDLSSWAGKID